MYKILPRQVDTVVIGNGPSALITSYILHGHIPVYDVSNPHHDPLLHEKLKSTKDLLNIDVDYVTEHFAASRISYSTQALPINVLLDTLIRPLGETDDAENKTCVRWEYDPSRAVSHMVVGSTSQAGGQWGDNPVQASWDIGTLSYAGMLSLPGYSFSDFYQERHGQRLPFYLRPARSDVAEYFAIYPSKVGIEDTLYPNVMLSGVRRQSPGSGFHINSHNISCDNLVLATGTFTTLIPPPPVLQPLVSLCKQNVQEPLLVIGSGFSAADVIISTPPSQKIIHLYKWAPKTAPSPLRACHQNAYPEYAGVYRKMKASALALSKSNKGSRPAARRASSSAFDVSRDWDQAYEGLPNAQITEVHVEDDGRCAVVTFQDSRGETFTRRIGSFIYVVGRRGSLNYLDCQLMQEICPSYDPNAGISGRDLRDTANEDLQVAPGVFIIGSLTGDTLIRFAYGGCVYAAGQIIGIAQARKVHTDEPCRMSWRRCRCAGSVFKSLCSSEGTPRSNAQSGSVSPSPSTSGRSSGSGSPTGRYVKSMTGLDGHQVDLRISRSGLI